MTDNLSLSDRVLTLVVLGGLFLLCRRIPFARFFAWLSEPSMVSLIFVSTFCISAQSILSQESAYKYWNPYLLEAAKFLFGTFGPGFLAVKAYRMIPEPKKDPPPPVDQTQAGPV